MPLFFKHQQGAQRLRMPWGAAIGAGISLIGNEMSSDKNGGAGSQCINDLCRRVVTTVIRIPTLT